DTRLYKQNQTTPVSKVEAFRVDGKWQPITNDKPFRLRAEQRDIEIRFTTFSFIDSTNIKIKFKLKGYDENWKVLPDSTNRVVSYTNLPYGKYEFVVLGTNNSGVWGAESSPLKFSIDSSYYETWYFYTTLVLIIIMTSLGIYRLRIRNLQRQTEVLEREVGKKTSIILAVADAGQQITAGFDFEQTMNTVYENIKSFMSADNLGVGLLNEDGTKLKYDYAVSRGKKYKPYFRDMADKTQLPVWCIENHKTVFINDVDLEGKNYIPGFVYCYEEETDHLLEDDSAGEKTYSILYAPIMFNDEVLGVIGIQSFKKNQYQSSHVDMLQSIANFTAIALINNRMHQQMIASEKREKERVEQQKKIAESANLAKSQFLATMSHEIRTPMNGVIGMVDLLKSTDLKEDQRHFVDIISRSGKTLLNIINDILDYSKIEAGKMELERVQFSILDLIDDCISLFEVSAKEKGLFLFVNLHPDVPCKLVGDPTRITQVLINLIGNAFKFTQRGSIAIEIKKLSDNDDYTIKLEFSVQDTGIGISHAAQKKLFESFHQSDSSTTRKYGGTGLGLAISKRISELMGGEIGVDSDEGVGARFWFSAQLEVGPKDKPMQTPNIAKTGRALFTGHDSLFFTNIKSHMHHYGIKVEDPKLNLALLDIDELFELFEQFDCIFLSKSWMNNQSEVFLLNFISRNEQSECRLFLYGNFGQSSSARKLIESSNLKVLRNPLNFVSCGKALTENVQAKPQAERADELDKSSAYADFSHLNVLVAEDNEINQVVIRSMLAKINIQPTLVENGLQALTSVHREKKPYDLILMDCEMPEMDGFEAASKIREFEQQHHLKPSIIFALTAHTMQEHQVAVKEAGMNYHLAKPVTLANLTGAIQSFKLDKSH
ncbi:MAG: ATP-binding protein, partial [Kangiellaceae bacterium]|nr:ATP-binding protein [Kangiellaceae bacterium]